MDLGIEGRRALITGSTAGIGLAAARALVKEGARVVVNGRTQARVDASVKTLRTEFPGAHVGGVAADLGTAAGCEEVVDQVPELDILVNSVGIFRPQPFESITDADWFRFFETNVLSGVRLSRHYLPGMRARNWGRVVFVSSESAVQIPSEMIHYGMTKTAQLAIARAALELIRRHVMTETQCFEKVLIDDVRPGRDDRVNHVVADHVDEDLFEPRADQRAGQTKDHAAVAVAEHALVDVCRTV